MPKKVLLACLAFLAMSAQAGPIAFFDVQFDVTAIALSDGPVGFDSQSSPPSAAPVSASAFSPGFPSASASAGASAGPGLLITGTQANGSGVASGVATAHFSGSFLNTGHVDLNIDFTPFGFALGSGSEATTLFVSLTSGGMTLFQDFVTGSQQFSFDLTPGTTSLLELTLSSEAIAGLFATDIGGAFSAGRVGFAGSAVPEPATLALLGLGLAGLGFLRRKQ